MPDVKIKNYNGEYIAYKDVEKLHLSAADSDELVPFSYGEAVSDVPVPLDLADGDQTLEAPAGTLVKSAVIQKPETLVAGNIRNGVEIAGVTGTLEALVSEGKAIELDFSNGDMVVTPDSGKAFSQVSIPKPANLTPDNIAEGVNIAGIIGTLAAGGGGGNIKTYYAMYNSTAGTLTINHNLGVIPDIVIAYVNNGYATTSYYNVMFGASTAARNAGITLRNTGISSSKFTSVDAPIDSTTTTNPINNATTSSLILYKTMSGYYYYVYLIYGLT